MPEPLFTAKGERYWIWTKSLKMWVSRNAVQTLASPKKQLTILYRQESRRRPDRAIRDPEAEKLTKAEQPAFMIGLDKAGDFLNFIDRNLPLTEWPLGGIEQLREDFEPLAKKLWPKPPWALE